MLTKVAESHFGHQLADDLLDSAPASPNELAGRAHALGHDLRDYYRAVALRWAGQALDDTFVDIVTAAAADLHMGCMTTRRDRSLIVLACRRRADAWANPGVWRTMHGSVARRLRGRTGSMGVGGVARAARDIPGSYCQALHALRRRAESSQPHGVTDHDELGILSLVSNPDAGYFVREWLAPLLDFDQQHRSDLTETLATYLGRGGSYGDTADALHIPRTTLRNRLHHIHDLTQYELTDAETRFNLHLATLIWRDQRVSDQVPQP